ncbi:MAG: molybdopterin-synthase adenylyltransferase MoeB [Phaeovulum sp.]|uniref:HesA/MoeB/ThiF family protein n=1 Tax=Phaeovulum sp. TaxID=2934796 RepID=UPI00272FBC11|nr:molybdopterin-synthase adenylyltransferase MoeB [Phaeovulum sp.]MDP2064234.1 molybdopterin-synthase adenylyltransferase MoeB [Phaeovulum sp.]MDP3862615.1 molybdopterin-synthase adenylyltransferase MoeB [Phaeovulum sp.]
MVLLLAIALVAFGLVLRFSARRIGGLLAGLWLAVVLAHLVLAPGNPLLARIGGSLAGWLVLGGAVALVLGYRAALLWLKARARPAPAPAAGGFSATELERYARHIVLREIGGPGQARLKAARVLVVGAGGLGSPVLLYLAAAGVGMIGVADDDRVSNSNLQRQVIHTDARIGMEKVRSAEIALKALNPFIELRLHPLRVSAGNVAGLVAEYDLILDGSDNFATRYLLNTACIAARKPLLSGAITQWEGQLSLYDPARGAPCYACVFPEAPAAGLAPACAEAGVMGALPGVVGAMMATEAIKEITGAGQSLRGRLVLHDALWGESRVIAVARNPDCPQCGAGRGGGDAADT